MKNLMILVCPLLAAATLALINTGCNSAGASSTGPQRGVQCTVQFRRDALGAAASLPISPMTGGINGADTALSGKLIGTTDEWIILESRGALIRPEQKWIVPIETMTSLLDQRLS